MLLPKATQVSLIWAAPWSHVDVLGLCRAGPDPHQLWNLGEWALVVWALEVWPHPLLGQVGKLALPLDGAVPESWP